jgi:hypothetical protein
MGPEQVREAIDLGIRLYWDDARKQDAAFRRWKEGGFEENCPQVSNGSINEYIFRSVMEMIRQQFTVLTIPGRPFIDYMEIVELRLDGRWPLGRFAF